MHSCDLAECDRLSRNKGPGLCEAHYYRARRGRPVHGPIQAKRPRTVACDVDGCDKPRISARHCAMHRARLDRHGDVETVIAPADRNYPSGPDHPSYKDQPGYFGMHTRLSNEKGAASAHACVDCGAPARQWSYDHSDPDELAGPWPYSLDLDRYVPRCVPCHKRLDLHHAETRAATKRAELEALMDSLFEVGEGE